MNEAHGKSVRSGLIGGTNREARATPIYKSRKGEMYSGAAEDVLGNSALARAKGKVQLIFTSPPYPLAREKRYGNERGTDYVNWLAGYAPLFREFLTENGSIVLEVGNSWVSGKPIMSTAVIEALLAFMKKAELVLCQEFVWYNPARLPTPTQWVNVKRIRVKDSFTRIWWMAKTPYPKADNRRVLKGYSRSMEQLLQKQSYNAGRRPSEHRIGAKSFLKNHGGAIPPNVFGADELGSLLKAANTRALDQYQLFVRENKITMHPARMPEEVAEFFIKFLTDENDLVLDPFAGSNTTGAVAERHNRRWIAVEKNADYASASGARFGVNGVAHPTPAR